MKSATLPSFWEHYGKLTPDIRAKAKKAYYLWSEDSFHPSLRFKCINKPENIWSVRVTLGYRAVGIMDDDTVTWFWIGSHDDYERFFG
jgi:hypothetical protein